MHMLFYVIQASPLITPESAKYIQHIVIAICPSYVDPSFLSDGPCNELAWLCYYGDDLPGWARGGGVCFCVKSSQSVFDTPQFRPIHSPKMFPYTSIFNQINDCLWKCIMTIQTSNQV